jgi:uncharacterized membrane protein YoaK (UPF0700 family)
VFTANMTGNMILLGLAAGQVQGFETLRSGVAFAGFAAGALGGAKLAGRGGPKELWPRRVTVALALELLLLGGLQAGWIAAGAQPVRPLLDVLIVLSAMAMGVQSAAIQRVAVPGVATTYVTGTLTSLMAELSALAHFGSGWPLRAGVVLALGVGAILEALVLFRWPAAAPAVPLLLLAAVAPMAARGFRRRS